MTFLDKVRKARSEYEAKTASIRREYETEAQTLRDEGVIRLAALNIEIPSLEESIETLMQKLELLVEEKSEVTKILELSDIPGPSPLSTPPPKPGNRLSNKPTYSSVILHLMANGEPWNLKELHDGIKRFIPLANPRSVQTEVLSMVRKGRLESDILPNAKLGVSVRAFWLPGRFQPPQVESK